VIFCYDLNELAGTFKNHAWVVRVEKMSWKNAQLMILPQITLDKMSER